MVCVDYDILLRHMLCSHVAQSLVNAYDHSPIECFLYQHDNRGGRLRSVIRHIEQFFTPTQSSLTQEFPNSLGVRYDIMRHDGSTLPQEDYLESEMSIMVHLVNLDDESRNRTTRRTFLCCYVQCNDRMYDILAVVVPNAFTVI